MSKSIKVLFIESSELSHSLHAVNGERLEIWTKDNAQPIKVDFIQTEGKTVGEVTDCVLNADSDAIVVEEGGHTFDDRDQAYKTLGLTQKKKGWEEVDPNYYLTGIALVEYLKKAFKKAGKNIPKFGYTDINRDIQPSKFEALGIKNNSDFYISRGYEGPDEHVQHIYDVLETK